MQTIGKNQSGQPAVQNQNIHNFLKSIVSIPKTTKFEEKLLNYTIQIDSNMAQVWTPYEFWLNGALSHCGVNSFQLFKEEKNWKIIYIIDTRRKENCTSPKTKNP